jgi:hypothetical protein
MNPSTHQPVAPGEVVTPSKSNSQAWYRPTLSPEHGVYVVLLVAFLIGAAAAQQWTWMTTLALICAFLGFQAEHPLVLQIKQRRSWKPRFLVWGGLYGTIALLIAGFLYLRTGDRFSPLLWIYAGAVVAFGVDAVSVFYREQKSIINEFITFAAVCLSAPFAYITTTGSISTLAIALWILNTLYFSSTIFIVKFRKLKTHPILPSLVYHSVAAAIILVLWYINFLPAITALAFTIALLKFVAILWHKEWYCTTKIQYVALLETISAIGFLTIAALSVLPARLG